MLLNGGVGEDFWESHGLQGDKPVNPKANPSWLFIERTDAEARMLWSPNVKIKSQVKISMVPVDPLTQPLWVNCSFHTFKPFAWDGPSSWNTLLFCFYFIFKNSYSTIKTLSPMPLLPCSPLGPSQANSFSLLLPELWSLPLQEESE